MIAGIQSTLTITPNNTAVDSGNSARFQCTTNSTKGSADISWRFGNNLIVSGCSGASGPYSTDSSSPGQCDLKVNLADPSLSGVYMCVEISTLFFFNVILTVIGKCPVSSRIDNTQNVKMFDYICRFSPIFSKKTTYSIVAIYYLPIIIDFSKLQTQIITRFRSFSITNRRFIIKFCRSYAALLTIKSTEKNFGCTS
jgi:hypothetical protein